MGKIKLAVKRYVSGDSDGFAIFKASQVRSLGDTITWEHGVDPFRGYYGLSKNEADTFKEQLEKQF